MFKYNFYFEHGQVMVVRRCDLLVYLVLLPWKPKALEHNVTIQFPCTLFTAVYIRHPQTKVEPIVYTTKCRRTVPSDEMHLMSDLDVTACILRKSAHRTSNNLMPKFPTLRKGEKRFGAYKVDKRFMVFYLQSPMQLTLACLFQFLNHSPKDSSTEIRYSNSNFS